MKYSLLESVNAVALLQQLQAQYGEDIPTVTVLKYGDGSYISQNYFDSTSPQGNELKVEEVEVAKCAPMQEDVEASHVAMYLQGNGRSGSDLPLICRDEGGILIIQDGHHRVFAAALKGERTIQAKVATVVEIGEDEETFEMVVKYAQ